MDLTEGMVIRELGWRVTQCEEWDIEFACACATPVWLRRHEAELIAEKFGIEEPKVIVAKVDINTVHGACSPIWVPVSWAGRMVKVEVVE